MSSAAIRRNLAVAAAIGLMLAAGCDEGPAQSAAPGEPPPAASAATTERATQSPARGTANASSWFTDVTAELGIEFAVERNVNDDHFMPDALASGCALLDYDNDGDLDLYVVNAFRNESGETVTDEGADVLYRQESDGRFLDVTAAAGLGDRGYGLGAAVGDYDNDGDLDLYVSNYGRDGLYRNNGDATFTDVTEAAGIGNDLWSASAGFFDADRDGFLDIYVANYVRYEHGRIYTDAAGNPDYPSPTEFDGTPDVLYRNNGDGTFRDVSGESGIGVKPGKGLGIAFTDLNGDGAVDIYVANDTEPNVAWINDGQGRFTDQALRLGIAVNMFGRPEAGMGIALGDSEGDGDTDLFVTHMVHETNTLYRRSGDAFDDETVPAGLGKVSFDFTGFGTTFLDVELDGDLDLAVINGRVFRGTPLEEAGLSAHWNLYAEPNQLLINDGAGRFRDGSGSCGDLCSDVEVSRGLAAGDLDCDGDLDLVVTNGNGTVRVYRNDAPRAGRWLAVRAIEPALNRDDFGAVVRVRAGGRLFLREPGPVQSYLSSSEVRAHFGLGSVDTVDAIEIRWTDGTREDFGPRAVDQAVELRKGEGRPAAADTESG